MVASIRAPGAARPLLRLASVALAAAAASSCGWAQPAAATPAMATAPSPVFAIRGFRVTGENPLGDGETSQVLAPFLRADANMETLQKATAALETALRDRGFGLHRVSLPPQELGDTVTLNIVKFSIGRVTVQGRTIYSEDNVRQALPELKEGTTPNFRRLAVQTAIANENPNKQYQVGLRESDQPDRIDATVTVKEDKPWTLGASLSNAGTPSTGRDRVTLSAAHSNLFDRDQQLVAAYTTSLQRTSDVKQIGLLYRAPLYAQGAVIGASYTRSDVVGNFGSFTSTGAGHTLGASYTLYLPPQGGRRSYLLFALDDKVFDATQVNGGPIGSVDRRSRPVTMGYNARIEGDTSAWGYDLNLAVNTGSGRGNDISAYQNENKRIETVHWKALRGGAYYNGQLPGSWTWQARTSYQYSPDVLIAGEQFGLGGFGSVRGTEIDRPITGDSGIQGTVEVTTKELAPGLRLLGFVDAGWLGNHKPDGVAKLSSDHLASVGLGLRYAQGRLAVSLDYGRIVTGSKVALSANSAAPKRGDDRFYVNVSLRF